MLIGISINTQNHKLTIHPSIYHLGGSGGTGRAFDLLLSFVPSSFSPSSPNLVFPLTNTQQLVFDALVRLSTTSFGEEV